MTEEEVDNVNAVLALISNGQFDDAQTLAGESSLGGAAETVANLISLLQSTEEESEGE